MAIEKSYLIHAPVSKVWQALVDPGLIDDDYYIGPLKKMVEDEAAGI